MARMWRAASRKGDVTPMRIAIVALVGLVSVAACSTASPAASPEEMPSHAMSHAPASGTTEPSPSASDDPLAACEGVEPQGDPIEIAVGTASYDFDPRVIEGPRHCHPFVIVFTNSDVPVPGSRFTNEHNISIRAENLLGPLLFEGEVIGQETIRYDIPGLPAGEHYMYCTVHPDQSGTVVVAPAEG